MNETKMRLKISILSYWHAGSGFGRGADADALVLKDRQGLPYLPGRSVKGLLREGMQTCEDSGIVPAGRTGALFGFAAQEGNPAASVPGLLAVSDAQLPRAEREWLSSGQGKGDRQAMYDVLASTSLDDQGLARDRTLRTIEVCVPLELTAEVTGPAGGWKDDLYKACTVIRGLGCHRNRGLGRCRFSLQEEGVSHA